MEVVAGRTGRKKSALNLKRTPGEGAGGLENVQLFPFADFEWLSSQLIFTQQEYTFLLPTQAPRGERQASSLDTNEGHKKTG